jgi:hypothetical protein
MGMWRVCVGIGFYQTGAVITQGSGFRVHEIHGAGAMVFDILRHVRIGPAPPAIAVLLNPEP